jgi:hypothetical protein
MHQRWDSENLWWRVYCTVIDLWDNKFKGNTKGVVNYTEEPGSTSNYSRCFFYIG